MPDLALTGVPRGGTTLACRLLGEPADALSLFEPMPVEDLALDAARAVAQVEDYFAQVRERVRHEHRAPTKHQGGRVPDNPFGDRAGEAPRPTLVELGEIDIGKPLTDRFHLTIKHNAAFLALLPLLSTRMPVLGVVRHPLAVLLSWHSLDLAVSRGRLPAGERLDPKLGKRLDALPDLLSRQLAILDWCFERLLGSLPRERVLRYEDIVADGGACLFEAAGLHGRPRADMRNRNANAQYDRSVVMRLADALIDHGGAAVSLYGREAIEDLATTMSAPQHG